MRAVSAGELTRLQSAAEALFDKTATRYRKVLTSNGAGGFTESETSTTYACNIAPTALWNMPMEINVAGRLANTSSWVIRMPHDADVLKDDRIVVDGEKYEVMNVHGDKSWRAALRAVCFKASET